MPESAPVSALSQILRRLTGKTTEPPRMARQIGFSETHPQSRGRVDEGWPPAPVPTVGPSQPRFVARRRLSREDAAGGGLVRGEDGQLRSRYWGHRERLRLRFLAGGHKPMPEYELLELLLFNAIPRIDVKPLAKRLFGGVR